MYKSATIPNTKKTFYFYVPGFLKFITKLNEIKKKKWFNTNLITKINRNHSKLYSISIYYTNFIQFPSLNIFRFPFLFDRFFNVKHLRKKPHVQCWTLHKTNKKSNTIFVVVFPFYLNFKFIFLYLYIKGHLLIFYLVNFY